jgi:DNA-binding response OmpR family regulator
MRPKVLVILGHENERDQVAEYVSAVGMEAVVAGNAAEGMSRCIEAEPAIIVADLDLPDMAGVEFCRRIRDLTFAPLIIISPDGDEMERVIALEVGADTVMQKPVLPLVFGAMLKRVLRRAGGQPPIPPNVLVVDGLQLDCESHVAVVEGQYVQLAPKEFALLEALVRRPGYVLSKEFLLSRIWEQPPASEDRALAVHMARLRRKIGDDARNSNRIITVPGVGYVFRSDPVEAL